MHYYLFRKIKLSQSKTIYYIRSNNILWHVERMDEYRMARRVLVAEVEGGYGPVPQGGFIPSVIAQAVRWAGIPKVARAILSSEWNRAIRGAQGVLPCVGRGLGWCDQLIGSTVSDAIVRSCCGRLQLEVPNWATSVDY